MSYTAENGMGLYDDGRIAVVRTLALGAGVGYALLGLAGFVLSGFELIKHPGGTLLGFHANDLHNIAHLALGVGGIALSRHMRTARLYGWLLLAGCGSVFLLGWTTDHTSDRDLAVHLTDNWRHLGSALLGLVILLLPIHRRVPDPPLVRR